MKDVSTITPARLKELAFAAGHKTSFPGGEPNVITEEMLAGYTRFMHLIYKDLILKPGRTVDMIDLSRIADHAKEATGFQLYVPDSEGYYSIDPMKLIASESRGLFFVRLATRIGVELQG